MSQRKTSYIVEGIDRLGKSTLIENLQQTKGFFNVIHYAKPKRLDYYMDGNVDGMEARAFEQYQRASFQSGFNLLTTNEPFIMDRFHLGEYVYANRYRKYNGDYVFGMEKISIELWDYHHRTTDEEYPVKLILLTTSDFSFLQDDGLSIDFLKKEEEQQDFIVAYHQSHLPKVMIDVSNGKGGYKSPFDILDEATK